MQSEHSLTIYLKRSTLLDFKEQLEGNESAIITDVFRVPATASADNETAYGTVNVVDTVVYQQSW